MSNPMPPQGGAPGGRGTDPMSANRTALNPTDMAFMQKSGQMRGDMTFGEFWENGFGIKWDTPLPEAQEMMKKNLQNSKPMGKMQNMAGGAPPAPPQGAQKPMPQGRKPMVQSGGLEGLLGQM